jgi:hypothetical protein
VGGKEDVMAVPNNNPSGWVGWAYFASFMLILLGALQILAGLAGIFHSTYYVVTQNHLLVFNFKTWGWIDLILGIVILIAGFELLRGAVWARVVAIFLAILSFVANMGFVNAYPVWSIVMMVVDALIIYALSVHGGELRE